MSQYNRGNPAARALFTLGGLAAIVLWMTTPPDADAAPLTCKHRSAEHAAQAHQTREGDSRWHVLHGQLPTCGLDDDKGSSGSDGDHGDHSPPRRDHPGFHCTWHGCG